MPRKKTAEVLAEASVEGIGLTRTRAEAIRGLACAVRDRRISFDGIMDCDDFRGRLCEIPGITERTAQYIAMRASGEPDTLPSCDAVLLRRLGLRTSLDLERRAEAWRPWRAYACMYIWAFEEEISHNNEVMESEQIQFASEGEVDKTAASNQRVSIVV